MRRASWQTRRSGRMSGDGTTWQRLHSAHPPAARHVRSRVARAAGDGGCRAAEPGAARARTAPRAAGASSTSTPRPARRACSRGSTGRSPAPPPERPRTWRWSTSRSNLDVLGLTESDLDTLQPPETSTAGAVTEVRWRQAVDGIPAADSELRVNVTRDGRVLNVLGSPAPDLDPDTTPSLAPGEAVRAVQDAVGVLPRAAARQRAGGRDPGDRVRRRQRRGADALQGRAGLARDCTTRRRPRSTTRSSTPRPGHVLQAHNMVKSAAPALGVGALSRVRRWAVRSNRSTSNARLPARRRERRSTGRSSARSRTSTTTTDVQSTPARRSRVPAARSTSRSSPRTTGTGCNATRPVLVDLHRREQLARRTATQNGVQAFYLANRFHDHLAAAPINFTTALRRRRPV